MRGGVFTQAVSAANDGPAVAANADADGIIDVPKEACTLQAALDAARSGATIRLAAGEYAGGKWAGNFDLNIVGAGPGKTTIRGRSMGPVMEVTARESAHVTVQGLSLTGGTGANGAGLEVNGGNVEVRQVSFRSNEASGALTKANSKSVFVDCMFTDNRNGFAGGALANMGGAVLMVNCSFEGNRAQTFGGAIYSEGGTVETVSCSFTENSTTTGAYGGALYGSGANLQVAGTSFLRNESRESGGAVFVQGGEASIDRCSFSGNLASEAWALSSRDAKVRLAGSTLCGDAQHLLGGNWAQSGGNAFDAACFPDCNQNGVSDVDELARGWARDTDGNGVPDECDLDCNQNGMPDAYELARGFAQDVNANGVIDACEIRMGLARDDDNDFVPDAGTTISGASGVAGSTVVGLGASVPSGAPAGNSANDGAGAGGSIHANAPRVPELLRRTDSIPRR
jgi:predicted outer membrane repeat protein